VPSRHKRDRRATCFTRDNGRVFYRLSFRIHTRAERSTSQAFALSMFALRRAAARAVAARGSFSPQRVALRAFAAQCPHDPSKPYHKSPLPLDAAGGLLEYSVVYTDRAMNHMSKPFCKVRAVMRVPPPDAPRARDDPGTVSPRLASRARRTRTKNIERWRTGCFLATGDLARGVRRVDAADAQDVLRLWRGVRRLARKHADAPRPLPRRSPPPHARACRTRSSPSAKTDATERVLSRSCVSTAESTGARRVRRDD
jgi:hypothetical protein